MPMELSIPASVSVTRGTGLPMRRFGVTLLVTSAPSRPKSIAAAYSCAKQPEAGMTGFLRITDPMRTARFTSTKLHLPGDRAQREHRAFAAYAAEHLVAVLVEQTHARQAHAHRTGHLLLERHFALRLELLQECQ